ncbi:MAG: HAD family hydrolase [Anaerolineae bacterium]
MLKVTWRAILFDFDYTLVDSSPGIIACANYALREMGLPDAAPERIRSTIGLTLAETFGRLTGSSESAKQQRFTELFVSKANDIMVASTTLYPSAREVIPGLAVAGFQLGVVSTKYVDRLAGVLKREHLYDYFQVLVGGDQVAAQKPAPDGLLAAAARLKLEASQCLYVGDTPTDARAAGAAGMDFVAVLSGPSRAEDFAPGTRLLGSLAELPAWLQHAAANEAGT